MPVTTDIAASYRRPGKVMRDHLERGATEARALAFLMGSCLILFVAQWPGLARQAHLTETELTPQLAAALMATILILPLVLYTLAWITQLGSIAIRRPISGLAARLALFWALLASTPLVLLNGLVEGFIGEGLEQQIVGFLWFVIFLWFWISSLRAARAAEEVV
jgi:hypothetical protein